MDARLVETVERVLDVLRAPRAGLVTDVDGTISPIESTPELARVLPSARHALDRLSALLTLVGVVSGRTVADARAMVGLDNLVYVGNHGLEVWTDGPHVIEEARPWVPRLAAVLEDIRRNIQVDGIRIENKGVTASLHYRLAPDPPAARRELLDVLSRCALTSGLRLEEGRMVLNLLPPLTVTKGSAVTWLAREYQLDSMVYLGDDVTDAHAFRALKTLKETTEIQTLCIGVVGPETPTSVRQLADASVPSVQSVAELLCALPERLCPGDTMRAGSRSARRHTHGD
jgi:trehalose 6-phosphate phosphatase